MHDNMKMITIFNIAQRRNQPHVNNAQKRPRRITAWGMLLLVNLYAPSLQAQTPAAESTSAPEPAPAQPEVLPAEPTQAPNPPQKPTAQPHTHASDKLKTKKNKAALPQALTTPEVVITGQTIHDLQSVAGAAHVIEQKKLKQIAPMTAAEALVKIPGVNIQAEDPAGLRLNIGFRGLRAERSRNVLVLEDGIPVQLMPYGEPELYYTPRIERMGSIEVVKGSSSVLYGPRTIGGVVNFVTLSPPDKLTRTVSQRVGNNGYLMTQAMVGDRKGDISYLIYGLLHNFDGNRNLDLRVYDVMGKVELNMHNAGTLSLKAQLYNEWSRATYLGLTTPQYEANSNFNFANNDRFSIQRYALTAIHEIELAKNTTLRTSYYNFNITRNWRRQDYDRRDQTDASPGLTYDRIINGQGRQVDLASSVNDGSSIFFRNTTGNRNRAYNVTGVESRLTNHFNLFDNEHTLTAGARVHYESSNQQLVQGAYPSGLTGPVQSQERLNGLAFAGYAMTDIGLLKNKLTLSPGARLEVLRSELTSYRDNFQDIIPRSQNDSVIATVIPGMGLSWTGFAHWTLFTGVHRGFAPPRTKDNITPGGANLKLAAERSWNYEAGARYDYLDWLHLEGTGFLLDFSNQIITPSEASGATNEVGAVNSGRTRHMGFEFAGTFDLGRFKDWSFNLPLSLNYTYVNSELLGGWGEYVKGNAVPYAPQHLLGVQAAFEHPSGLSLSVQGDYVSAQFADIENTDSATLDGLRGKIPAWFLLNARAAYMYKPWRLSGFITAKNMLDHRYMASRAPAGIQPGLPRQVIAGLEYTF